MNYTKHTKTLGKIRKFDTKAYKYQCYFKSLYKRYKNIWEIPKLSYKSIQISMQFYINYTKDTKTLGQIRESHKKHTNINAILNQLYKSNKKH